MTEETQDSTALEPNVDQAAIVAAQESAPEPEAKEEPAPKLSTREMMEAELAKVQAAEKKDSEAKDDGEAKAESVKPAPKESAKAERSDGVKPAAVPGEAAVKPSEGNTPEPPARFLPRAREVWPNTPNPVKAEIARWEREHAQEVETHRVAKAFHEELREYDDLARSHGTTVKQALASYTALEKGFAENPDEALPRLLQTVKMNPMQAVLAVLRSAGATPEQFAQHVLANPAQYQQQAPVQRPAAPTPDPYAQKALQEVAQLRQQLLQQDVYSSVVAPFAADHPRFEELQDPIAKLLESGMIPDNMSAAERLEVAYDMAERLNPTPYREAPKAAPAMPEALVNPVAGSKSIKGAPTGGKTPVMRTQSIRDLLAANMPP